MTEEEFLSRKHSKKELIDMLYYLQNNAIKCSDYSRVDNLLFFMCYHCMEEEMQPIIKDIMEPDPYLVTLAGDAAGIGMYSYITNEANKLLAQKKTYKIIEVEDIVQEGMMAFSMHVKPWNPIRYPNTQIHSYCYRWIINAMEKKIDEAIKGMKLEDHDLEVLGYIKAKTFLILTEKRKRNPNIQAQDLTAQDYFNAAKAEGKDIAKFNLNVIARVLELNNAYVIRSIEEMEAGGIHVQQDLDTFEEAVNNIQEERIYKEIEKLGFFERHAIIARMTTAGTVSEIKGIQKSIYDEFKKQLKEEGVETDVSQRDFGRLLADAQEELSRRLQRDTKTKKKTTYTSNSLKLDDSFDAIMNVTSYKIQQPSLTENEKMIIFNKDFNEVYPLVGTIKVPDLN